MKEAKRKEKYKLNKNYVAIKRNRLLSFLKSLNYPSIDHLDMAQTYQSNIPALDDVRNRNAANDLLHAKAPGIVRGQNIDPKKLQAAVYEANALQSYRTNRPTRITAMEVGQAFDRAHAIANEHAAGTYAQAMAPAWFNNALTNALAPIQVAIANMQESIIIRLENQDIKRENGTILALRDTLALLPLKKQVAGVGPGLPGHNVQIAPAAVVAFGAFMNVPPFPGTKADLNNLTELELSELSAMYNEDFGIIPGDTVEIQRKKFRRFIG